MGCLRRVRDVRTLDGLHPLPYLLVRQWEGRNEPVDAGIQPQAPDTDTGVHESDEGHEADGCVKYQRFPGKARYGPQRGMEITPAFLAGCDNAA
jgi:hypothetical protein